MIRIYSRNIILILFCHFSLLCIVSAQPGTTPGNFNILLIKSDTNVNILNYIYVPIDFYAEIPDRSISYGIKIESMLPFYPISIIKENIVSLDQDTLFCMLKIQLEKGKDTMRVFIDSVLFRYESLNPINYVIRFLKFNKGNYYMRLKKPDEDFSYKTSYVKILNSLSDFQITDGIGLYDAWDITPDNWEDLRIDNRPEFNKQE